VPATPVLDPGCVTRRKRPPRSHLFGGKLEPWRTSARQPARATGTSSGPRSARCSPTSASWPVRRAPAPSRRAPPRVRRARQARNRPRGRSSRPPASPRSSIWRRCPRSGGSRQASRTSPRHRPEPPSQRRPRSSRPSRRPHSVSGLRRSCRRPWWSGLPLPRRRAGPSRRHLHPWPPGRRSRSSSTISPPRHPATSRLSLRSCPRRSAPPGHPPRPRRRRLPRALSSHPPPPSGRHPGSRSSNRSPARPGRSPPAPRGPAPGPTRRWRWDLPPET
jgi:hypothetical protein